jgi:Tfp pilus assembly PilM family ATPase
MLHLKEYLQAVLSNLSAEISNVLKFHNEHSTVRVEKVLLSGGGSKMLHLKEYLQEQFTQDKMTVMDAQPWILNKQIIKHELLSDSAVLDLTTAIGLATRYLI